MHQVDASPDVDPATSAGTRTDRLVVGLAVATAVCTYALVVLGSTVRVTNSGMGCPSWPLCYGHLGPVDRFHALVEQSHRYLVALVSLGAFATAVAAKRARVRRMARWPALGGACLIVVQAALGALTVLAKNAPWTVAVHLVVGLVFFGVVVATATTAARAPQGPWSLRAPGWWGWALVGAVLATVVGGSLVVANGAGGACAAWPLCPASSLATWQLVHRALAAVTGVSLVAFVVTRWRTTSGRGRAVALAAVALYAAVAAFGAASALTRAAALWQDVHLAMVAMLWASVAASVSALVAPRHRADPARRDISPAVLALGSSATTSSPPRPDVVTSPVGPGSL